VGIGFRPGADVTEDDIVLVGSVAGGANKEWVYY